LVSHEDAQDTPITYVPKLAGYQPTGKHSGMMMLLGFGRTIKTLIGEQRLSEFARVISRTSWWSNKVLALGESVDRYIHPFARLIVVLAE
jgi:hypothetical protein